MFAHITAGTVDAVGQPPRLAYAQGRWYDLRTRDSVTLATAGWYPVTETARPADTPTTRWEPVFTPTGATVTQSWTEVAKTAEQIADDQAQADAERRQLEDAAILTAIASTAQPPADGAAWVAPSGAHDAYPLDATVTHGGKTWVSLTPFNVWEPGVSSWREQVTQGYPAWVQPTGAQDAYGIGDRVFFEGANYESLIAANTWSPTVYPAGWKAIP